MEAADQIRHNQQHISVTFLIPNSFLPTYFKKYQKKFFEVTSQINSSDVIREIGSAGRAFTQVFVG
jgi:uncharacterized protein YqkB